MFGTETSVVTPISLPTSPRLIANPIGIATASTITCAGTDLSGLTAFFTNGNATRMRSLASPPAAPVPLILPAADGSDAITSIGVQFDGGGGTPSIGNRDLAMIVMP